LHEPNCGYCHNFIMADTPIAIWLSGNSCM
jgi:hypothetical protein